MLPGMTSDTHARDRRSSACDLPIEGMTCASCAARIERGLGRPPRRRRAPRSTSPPDRATVIYDPAVTGPDVVLGRRSHDLGYSVPDDRARHDPEADELARPRARASWSRSVLDVPVLADLDGARR